MPRLVPIFIALLAFPLAAPAQPPAAPPVLPREGLPEQVHGRAQDTLALTTDIHKDLEYAKAGDRPLKLDLYIPKEGKTPFPLIIWVHGGGWQAGSKDRPPALPLLKDGFAVASIAYRFTDAAPFPAQIHDVMAAVRYLRASAKEHRLDPGRFGAWGASAGGHLVALLGTGTGVKELEGDLGDADDQSSRIQAVCDWFGPTDFIGMPEAASKSPSSMLHKLFGGPMTEKREIARLASPVTHITPDDAPTLIMHGDEDRIVHLSQSQKFEEALKGAGVPATLEVFQGKGHGPLGPEAFPKLRAFFIKHLKPAEPPTQPDSN